MSAATVGHATRPAPDSRSAPPPDTSCAAACSARRAARSCALRPAAARRGSSGSFRSPNTIASAGQACWHAVLISPSRTGRSSFSDVDLRRVDPLHAVGALLHHAAAAHGDVGVAPQLQARRVPVLIEQEVEAADLVGTVVRAVARADAAVVDHVVQPFVAVHRRADRADDLARRVLALHARHRLEVGLRILGRPAVVACRRGASASRGRAAPGPCRPPGCCSPPGSRRRRRCSRCRR